MSYAARRSTRQSRLAAAATAGGGGGRHLYCYLPALMLRPGDRTYDPDGAYQISAVLGTVRAGQDVIVRTQLTCFTVPADRRLPVWRPQ